MKGVENEGEGQLRPHRWGVEGQEHPTLGEMMPNGEGDTLDESKR